MSFSRKSFSQKADYSGCIEKAKLAGDAYRKKNRIDNVLWTNIRIGLCWALLGNFEMAYDQAIENDRLIQNQNLVKASHFNNLTWILMDRCQDFNYDLMRQGITNWSVENQSSKNLLELLALVEDIKCSN